MKPRYIGSLLIVVVGLALSGGAWAGGLQLEPSLACDLLSDQGLRTSGGYRVNGSIYQCGSPRRALTGGGQPNNSIRFVASGSEGYVTQLALELQVNSQTAVQRAHRQLVDRTRILFERGLVQDLPGEIEAAILSAVHGQWTINGHEVTLDRIVTGGPVYELRLRIR